MPGDFSGSPSPAWKLEKGRGEGRGGRDLNEKRLDERGGGVLLPQTPLLLVHSLLSTRGGGRGSGVGARGRPSGGARIKGLSVSEHLLRPGLWETLGGGPKVQNGTVHASSEGHQNANNDYI